MRFAGLRDDDHAAVRAATESLMHRILRLSGQEYVDRYASDPHARPERGHHRPLTGDDGDQRRDVS
jgi:1-acyl-sn-glycerol-3-phosphate acyltransferase